MTLRNRDLSVMPPDIAAVGQRLMDETAPYRVIGDHLADVLHDAQFADLYQPTGRNAVSPSLLALVTIFQFLEDVPDREAAAMVVLRLDWKYALHLPVAYRGFDYSILCDFRQRVLAHGKDELLFDAILEKVKALGFIKKRGKQRTDSIAVVGAVRQLSALETVTETLRTTIRALEKADPVWAETTLPASFREQYAHLRPDYRLTKPEREALMRQVGADGLWLLEQITAAAPEAVRTLNAVQTMRSVWEQRYHRVEGKVAVREQSVACTALIVTPHDPGVRAGEKRGKRWHGEKVHVTETAEVAAEGENFITVMTTANASSGDAQTLPAIRQKLVERAVVPEKQYVDSGYVSGQQMAQSQSAGIILMGPPLADTSPNGFKISAFTIDRETKQATCPDGKQAVKWRERTDRDGSKAVNIQFAAAECAVCPTRAQCTTSQSGRSVHLSEHYEILEARRAEAQTAEFREEMRARPAIEATLSELVRQHGLRRHRYRGDAKRHFENLLKGAACNLKRLARALRRRWEREKTAAAGGGQLVVASS